MQSLEGKTALITGAGKGLGKAMALALAKEGVNLLLLARTASDLENVAKEAQTINSSIRVVTTTADVANYQEVKTAVDTLTAELTTIDILINSAGVLKVGGLLELPIEEWEQVFKVNVFGTYYLLREVLPIMVQNGSGDVFDIASTAGLKGSANMSAYGASKAAVINLTESVMQEFRKKNIRVTTINPSTIATEMTLAPNFTDGNPERVLQPEDLAHLIVSYLKLPQRAFVKDFSLWSTNP